jgi:hypothetical protein
MNTEKINAAAWEVYPNEPNIVWGSIVPTERTAFIAGITYAAAKPDVIGCVKVEDVEGFLRWVEVTDWYFDNIDNVFRDDTTATDKRFSALFQIYQQQKQQG